MAKKVKKNVLGAWAFLVGFVIAVILGIFSTAITGTAYDIVLWTLVLFGVIIGLLNVTRKESSKFLIAAFALVIVSYMGMGILTIIPQIGNILSALLVLFVPATIVVALKSVFEITKD